MIFQSDSVVEGLGDRLDREFLSGVAYLVNRTVGGYQADAKPIRVRITEFRDIGRQFAFAIVAQAAVEVVEYQLDGRHVRGKSGHDQNARVLGCVRYTVQNASRLIVRNRFFDASI